MDAVPVLPLSGSTCLVTGAAGFVGRNLVDALVARGCKVKALDRVAVERHDPAVTPIVADVTHRPDLDRAMQGVDCVFHTAARILLCEFAPREVAESIHAVNIVGTRNVVESAIDAGVKRLVHTSSASVVYGPGTAGGDESLPYSPHEDLYTTSKVASERIVLAANGRGSLLTAALRPGGIYGPGERHQLLRPTLEAIKRGEPVTVIGDGSSRLDYTFIDNLVDAELRAAERLAPGSPVCGQAYFVSDGQPINHGEWSRRLVERMGLSTKVRHVPGKLLEWVGVGMERVYQLRGKPEPKVKRMQVRTCVLDAWYSIDKARRELGYRPLVTTFEGIDRCVVDALALYRTLPSAA